MRHDASAMTHGEPPASLVPRAITSSTAAPATAARRWASALRPDGERMTSPNSPRSPRRGRPKIATDSLPASAVPSTQGRARTNATSTAFTATRPAPRRSPRPPGRNRIPRPRTVTRTMGTTAGAKPAAAAMMAPRMTTWPVQAGSASAVRARPHRGPRRPPRANRSTMKGKAAYATSPPSGPCRARRRAGGPRGSR